MHDYINNLKKNTPIDSELYFRSLQNNTMTFDAFKESQTNFYGAVCYFSRPLFALCSRIDNYVVRLTILENIFDEHGNGNINEAHGNTYKKYLINLGNFYHLFVYLPYIIELYDLITTHYHIYE